MSIKSDNWIKKMALENGMIEPFASEQVNKDDNGERIISYGLSSYGYDIRCKDEFKIFTNINNSHVDPKSFDPSTFVYFKSDKIIIPPNSFALAVSKEYIRVPSNVLVVCIGKSTYARCGAIINVTPLEPSWEGEITLEISNTTPLPLVIHANEGIAQLMFFESDDQCAVTYADRSGKYMKQRGVTLPKTKEV